MVALRVLAVAVISTLTTRGEGAGFQTKEAAEATAGLHRAILQGPTAAAHRLQEENTIGGAGTLAGKIVLKPS